MWYLIDIIDLSMRDLMDHYYHFIMDYVSYNGSYYTDKVKGRALFGMISIFLWGYMPHFSSWQVIFLDKKINKFFLLVYLF